MIDVVMLAALGLAAAAWTTRTTRGHDGVALLAAGAASTWLVLAAVKWFLA